MKTLRSFHLLLLAATTCLAAKPPLTTFPKQAKVQEALTAGENSAKAKLSHYHEMFHTGDIDCSVSVRHGPPVVVIREVADEVSADYIIMGSHGHGKLYDFLVGSTASGVIKKAKCGIIIVPPADKNS